MTTKSLQVNFYNLRIHIRACDLAFLLLSQSVVHVTSQHKIQIVLMLNELSKVCVVLPENRNYFITIQIYS